MSVRYYTVPDGFVTVEDNLGLDSVEIFRWGWGVRELVLGKYYEVRETDFEPARQDIPLHITTEGLYHFIARDEAGNVGSFNAVFDFSPPVSTIKVPAQGYRFQHGNPPRIAGRADDNLTGIAHVWLSIYSHGTGKWRTKEGWEGSRKPYYLEAPGKESWEAAFPADMWDIGASSYTATVQAEDSAGLREYPGNTVFFWVHRGAESVAP